MENAKPSQVISDILEPLRRCCDIERIHEYGITLEEIDTFKTFYLTFLKKIVIDRLYAYFIYPPSCWCKKGQCLCSQKRQAIFITQALNHYLSTTEIIKAKLWGTGVEKEEVSIKNYEYLGIILEKQIRILTGIRDDRALVDIARQTSVESEQWQQTFRTLKENKKSDYSIALGIGRHFLFQVNIQHHDELKTNKGRRGYLSLNQILLDVTGKNGVEGEQRGKLFFDNVIPSRRNIIKSFSFYRSILHLILGIHAPMSSQETELFLFFLPSCAIQKNFIESAIYSFTGGDDKALFTSRNIAILPCKEVFSFEPSLTQNHGVIFNRDGYPIIYRKDLLPNS